MKPFVLVLTYQKIGIAPQRSRLKNQWVSPTSLDKTLAWLVRKNFTFITPKDLQHSLSKRPVLLTFMGGYQSFYTEVFPLLKKHKAKATVFVATNTLGTYNSWQDPHLEPWQNIITPTQLKEVYTSGLVQIGALGLTGENLLALAPRTAQTQLAESLYRLKTHYNLEPCAIGFWPNISGGSPNLEQITGKTSLPIIMHKRENLRVLCPNRATLLFLNFVYKFLISNHNSQ